ncbi:hypothetical protein B0H11DRAFT_1918906 [Mycena galericulata]|nr:hypothetical protein B0H11DRAFT_1918906 [Mycena galericulata]
MACEESEAAPTTLVRVRPTTIKRIRDAVRLGDWGIPAILLQRSELAGRDGLLKELAVYQYGHFRHPIHIFSASYSREERGFDSPPRDILRRIVEYSAVEGTLRGCMRGNPFDLGLGHPKIKKTQSDDLVAGCYATREPSCDADVW